MFQQQIKRDEERKAEKQVESRPMSDASTYSEDQLTIRMRNKSTGNLQVHTSINYYLLPQLSSLEIELNLDWSTEAGHQSWSNFTGVHLYIFILKKGGMPLYLTMPVFMGLGPEQRTRKECKEQTDGTVILTKWLRQSRGKISLPTIRSPCISHSAMTCSYKILQFRTTAIENRFGRRPSNFKGPIFNYSFFNHKYIDDVLVSIK